MEAAHSMFPIAAYWAGIQGLNFYGNIWLIILLGFSIGILVGMFGIAGRFLMPPWLNIFFSFPYNVAVGSDLGQMLGTSFMNLIKFKGMHNVDYKLGGIMLVGTIGGVELGAHLLEWLKGFGNFLFLGLTVHIMDLILSIFYSALLLWIGLVVYREAKGQGSGDLEGRFLPAEQPAITARLQHIRIPPMVSLPVSGIEAISIWIIIFTGIITGLLVGLLGVGGGFIRLPAFIYVIGCPMVVAIGTDFFENIFSMGYGTFTHSLKGNVDLLLVMVLLISVALGGQVGVGIVRRVRQQKIRVVFAYIAFATIGLMVVKLWV